MSVVRWIQHEKQNTYCCSALVCGSFLLNLFIRGVIINLDIDFRTKYLLEMTVVAEAVKNAFGAEKINCECLGNGDVHLHWHIFPRKTGDLSGYGDNGKGPVWWLPKEIMWAEDNKPSLDELKEMKAKFLAEIEKLL